MSGSLMTIVLIYVKIRSVRERKRMMFFSKGGIDCIVLYVMYQGPGISPRMIDFQQVANTFL